MYNDKGTKEGILMVATTMFFPLPGLLPAANLVTR
jgi:hypothetical protein